MLIHNHIPRRCSSTTMSAQVNLNKFMLGWNEFSSPTSLIRTLCIGACQPFLTANFWVRKMILLDGKHLA